MSHMYADNKQELTTALSKELSSHISDEQSSSFATFLDLFFNITSMTDLKSYRQCDLSGCTLAFWRFIQNHDVGTPQVEVFNPDHEHHGWHSTHTIVRIVYPDMPFIVDSLRMRLSERCSTIHHIRNGVTLATRDKVGQLMSLASTSSTISHDNDAAQREAFVYIEVDRLEDAEELEALKNEMINVLSDVKLAVTGYQPICEKVKELVRELSDLPQNEEISETVAYLNWLLDNKFTFLAYEGVEVRNEEGQRRIRKPQELRIGLLRPCRADDSDSDVAEPCIDQDFFTDKTILSFAKAAFRSSVHRPAYPDFVIIKRFDEKGEVIGESRIMGLYTSPVYKESPWRIPVLRRKMAAVTARSGLDPSTHHGKELTQILEVLPREELFQMPLNQLFHTAIEILKIQERNRIRVFTRRDRNGLFCSVLVYVPREVYSTELRRSMEEILCRRFSAIDSEFTTYFSESSLARVHFVLRLESNCDVQIDQQAITEEIIRASSTWEDEFREAVLEAHGEVLGNRLIHDYGVGFSAGYKEVFNPLLAVSDIEHVRKLSTDNPLAMSFHRPLNQNNRMHFKVFHFGEALPLADQIPILENLGLKVVGEYPYTIRKSSGSAIWLHYFSLDYTAISEDVDIEKVACLFQDAFRKLWYREAENDLFNRLVLAAGMDWRAIMMFRAYSRYLKQIRFGFSQHYMAETLYGNTGVARQLLDLFKTRFDPTLELNQDERSSREEEIRQSIYEALEHVHVLSEDRILRRFVDVICATLRTSFYCHDEKSEPLGYMALKFSPRLIPDIPKPAPMFEIFVYSPRVEGVHLRGGKIARGGLRWSDRVEDFRTEVLGLVKAQQVKNSVIVPVGAKGGFVPKHLPSGDRDAIMAEGIACYKIFIQALLDVTDNLVNGKVVYPDRVIRHDEDDYYLVVAADKGTATFSDIANGIAESYGFWLGDAFASGGSAGYDHKKMGITAKGAWVSVQRHFREQGVNIQKDRVSVVAVGDMAGDVFGNGMLLSQSLALVSAFNHLHIFVDPNPDVMASWQERKRLFELPRSSWEDYDQTLISEGGGIFSRSVKSIAITPQMKICFGISENNMTPTELINAILRAQVDLLWNGGIGTYVKASAESHADVGDRANDALRIDGADLNCQVVGEGGNLGLTQLGRIDYALKGGALNTDFIDNAGGVDCSDHEVNIKILLNEVVARDEMTRTQRDTLLESMTEEVSDLVLGNNYRQAQAISLAELEVKENMDEYRRFMHYLELEGNLDREIEFLPNDESLNERIASDAGLTRPELSVLISYSKANLKEQLVDSRVPDDQYLAQAVTTAFPATLVSQFGEAIQNHRLKREIVATQIANSVINTMGITFVNRMEQSTGADAAAISRAFVIARDIFCIEDYWQQIEELDYQLPAELQQRMMMEYLYLLQRAIRWLLRIDMHERPVSDAVEYYGSRIQTLVNAGDSLLSGGMRERWESGVLKYTEKGVPTELAQVVAGLRHMFSFLSIIQAAEQTGQPLERVAVMFFAIGDRLELNWFYNELSQLDVDNHWQSLARESVRDELSFQQRSLTVALLNMPQTPGDLPARLDSWIDNNQALVERWLSMLGELKSGCHNNELAMYMVAAQELAVLAHNCGQ